VGNLGDQSYACKTIQCPPASMMLTVGIWNMISLDAYSDGDSEDEDEPYSPKQIKSATAIQKDKVSMFDSSTGESGSQIANLEPEISDKSLDESVFSCGDPREPAGQPIEQVGQSFNRETLLQFRCKIQNAATMPLWRTQSFVPAQAIPRNDIRLVKPSFKDAPWRNDVAKLTLRPPPGLEDVLWEKSHDERCPSTCDGSSASCSGESESETHESDSETSDREADSQRMVAMSDVQPFESSFKGAPWRKRATKTTLNAPPGLEESIEQKNEDKPDSSDDDKESKRPWRKMRSQTPMATGTSTSKDQSVEVVVKVAPWRKDGNRESRLH